MKQIPGKEWSKNKTNCCDCIINMTIFKMTICCPNIRDYVKGKKKEFKDEKKYKK